MAREWIVATPPGRSPMDDGGGRRDTAIVGELSLDVGEQSGNVLGVRTKLAGPQHERRPAARHVIGRGRLWSEAAAHAAFHQRKSGQRRDGVDEGLPEDGRCGDVVVPCDAAGPGVGHRRDQHQPRYEIGMIEREARGDDAGQRVSHDYGPVYAAPLGSQADQSGLPRRIGVIGAARSIAPAVARAIDSEDAVAFRQGLGQRQRHVGRVAGGPVDQEHRRASSAAAAACPRHASARLPPARRRPGAGGAPRCGRRAPGRREASPRARR